MTLTRTAKLFRNGASQAVRLPSDFRFEGQEVFVSRDGTTGDVVLSTRPGVAAWADFFELLHLESGPAEFMAERPMNQIPKAEGLFDDQVS